MTNRYSDHRHQETKKEINLEKVKYKKLTIYPGWTCPNDKKPCKKKCLCLLNHLLGFL